MTKNAVGTVRGNPYHDAEGKFTSKNGMHTAIADLRTQIITLSSSPVDNFEKIAELSAQYSTMKKEYEDFSGEDYETGTKITPSVSDTIIAEAKKLAQQAEGTVVPDINEDGLYTAIRFSKNPTWEPAGSKRDKVNVNGFSRVGNALDDFRETYARETNKPSSGYIPPKVIAQKVRDDIKKAIEGGYLPGYLQYSTRVVDANSWVPGIEITVRGLANSAIEREAHFDSLGAHELKSRVRGIIEQYTYSQSDGFDNYNSNLSATASIEAEGSRKHRLEKEGVNKQKNELRKHRTTWLDTVKTNMDSGKKLDLVNEYVGDKYGIAQIDGTKYYVKYRRRADGVRTPLMGYDFSADNSELSATEEREFSKRILQYANSPLVKSAKFDLPDYLTGQAL